MSDSMTGAGRVALGLSIAFVVLLCIGPVVDPDLGFHVATGRAILAAGAIPATNVLSFAAPNAIAVNQQWLPAVLLELAFTHGGPAAVVAIRVLVVVLTFIVVAATARALSEHGLSMCSSRSCSARARRRSASSIARCCSRT